MRCLLYAALILMGLAAPAAAGFETGADLLAACEDPDGGGYAEMYCLGYITAVADVLEKNGVNGQHACIPDEGVTSGELAEVARAYLHRYPERGGFGAAGLVADALRSTWPCRAASAE